MIADALSEYEKAKKQAQVAFDEAVQSLLTKTALPVSDRERRIHPQAAALLTDIRSEVERRRNPYPSDAEWSARALLALGESMPYFATLVSDLLRAEQTNILALETLSHDLEQEFGSGAATPFETEDWTPVTVLARDPRHDVLGIHYRVALSSVDEKCYVIREAITMPSGACAGFIRIKASDRITTDWSADDLGVNLDQQPKIRSRFWAIDDWQYFSRSMLAVTTKRRATRYTWHENILTQDLVALFREHNTVSYAVDNRFIRTEISTRRQTHIDEAIHGHLAIVIMCVAEDEAVPRIGACFIEAKKVELCTGRCHDLTNAQVRRLARNAEFGRLLIYDWNAQDQRCMCTASYLDYLKENGTQRSRLEMSLRPFADDLFENIFLCRHVETSSGSVDAALAAIRSSSSGVIVRTGVGRSSAYAGELLSLIPTRIGEIENMIRAVRTHGERWKDVLLKAGPS